jgi:hypothetical protein
MAKDKKGRGGPRPDGEMGNAVESPPGLADGGPEARLSPGREHEKVRP